ncbi:MAG: precorrin-3B C(17)-methyltransferase, partial [Methylococcales bacterium]|nr:precorrin-3B C(17)-methyltransferase [Methylococcales bacterium]
EQAGRSLSMGLEGWKSCLNRYLEQHQTLTWEKIADFFNVPVGEVLSAVTQNTANDSASHKAIQVNPKQLQQVLQASANWGRLRGVVRTDSGAVVELFLHGKDFVQKADWLSIENEAFHLHVNWSLVTSAYFASREDKTYGLHFIDQHGRLVFRISLTKQDGNFNPEELQSYQQDWQTFGTNETQELSND